MPEPLIAITHSFKKNEAEEMPELLMTFTGHISQPQLTTEERMAKMEKEMTSMRRTMKAQSDLIDELIKNMDYLGKEIDSVSKETTPKKENEPDMPVYGPQLGRRKAYLMSRTKCYNCGEKGHMGKHCPQPQRADRGQTRTQSAVRAEPKPTMTETKPKESFNCYNCGKAGHLARDCIEHFGVNQVSRKCYNCGKYGHLSKDCVEPRRAAKETKEAEVKQSECCEQCEQIGELRLRVREITKESTESRQHVMRVLSDHAKAIQEIVDVLNGESEDSNSDVTSKSDEDGADS